MGLDHGREMTDQESHGVWLRPTGNEENPVFLMKAPVGESRVP